MTSTTMRSRVLSEWIALPLLLALALSVRAQETPKVAVQDELQEVVVTGSRIARPELDNLQPTTVIDAKTFDQRGYLDVGQALSELPQFGIQPSSAQNAQSNSGIAQSFVDLYSLGSQRTLVLVNGRRFPSSSTASLGNSNSIDTIGGPGSQVDLNTIPTKLIDHVETIAVGGAPIYGADAIAGTVNIILKKDYEGLDVDGQVGASGQGDAWNYRARALFGQNFFDNRANITGVAEFTKTDGLNGLSRPIFSQSSAYLPPATPGMFGNVLTPNLAIPAVSFGGVPMVDDSFLAPAVGLTGALVGVTNAAGQTLAFGPGGSLVPYNVGKNTGNPVFTSGGDGLQLAQVSNLLSPTERINFDILPNFKVNDSLTLFGEGWFSETHATNLVSQPAYNSALFGIAGGKLGGNFVISLNNPFLSAADRQTIQTALNNYAATLPFGAPLYQGVAAGPGQPIGYPAWNNQQFYLGRASVDLQNDGATATQVLARGVLGANGKFSVGDRNFTWDVAGSYGTSSNTSSTPSYVFQNLENALNATTNAQGQIVCGGTPVNAPISTGSSTCAPLNIFGNGSPSAAALAYITHMAEATSLDSQRDFSANLQADVWKLPGGEWKAAAGFENRRESADFSPDAFYTENLGYGTATAIEGSYITNELYLETLIPIFGPAQDIPFLHSLEAESAARRVDNSLAGDATTYTYGLRWSPVPDVQFRGNKTKSIRAPSITELFLPSATSFQFADDPCDKNFYQQGTAPATRLKNCEAAGINPATFNSNAVGATVQGLTGGNPDLMSETAFSKTYGVVLRPRWIPKLNMSVDYIDINLKGAISALTLQDNLIACYDSSNYPNDPACNSFTRNAAGQITSFHAGYVNAGLLHFSGIQAALDYPFDLPWSLGTLEARAHYLDMQRLDSQIGEASVNSLAGLIGTSKTKITIDLLYSKQSFFWDWQGIYIGPANFSNSSPTDTYEFPTVAGWWLINSTLGVNVTPQFKVQFIIDNVFNKLPPFPALTGTAGGFTPATSQYFSGIIGRTLQLSADYKF